MATLASALLSRPAPPAVAEQAGRPCKVAVRDLHFFYGEKRALEDISIEIPANLVTAFIGPSGCGKSTFLRTLNRMNDIVPGVRVQGEVKIDGRDVYGADVDVVALRRRVGMVFQKSNPFPKSIFENIAYGLRINRMTNSRAELHERVEESLKQAAIWDEVKDRLHDSAFALSGGQQQRLCIARALAVEPEVLLLDEPVSSLDVSVQAQILTLLEQLRAARGLSYVIVSHDLAVVAQLSTRVAVLYGGRLVEDGPASVVLSQPHHPYTQALLAAAKSRHDALTGEPPSPFDRPSGCVFRSRCPKAFERCGESPPLTGEKHRAACWLPR